MTRINDIRARCEAATPEPWHACDLVDGDINDKHGNTVARVDPNLELDPLTPQAKANADFLLNARQDIPWLLSRVESLESCLRDLRDVCHADVLTDTSRADALLSGADDPLRKVAFARASDDVRRHSGWTIDPVLLRGIIWAIDQDPIMGDDVPSMEQVEAVLLKAEAALAAKENKHER